MWGIINGLFLLQQGYLFVKDLRLKLWKLAALSFVLTILFAVNIFVNNSISNMITIVGMIVVGIAYGNLQKRYQQHHQPWWVRKLQDRLAARQSKK